jgi:toxin ParE1/3/4
VKRSVHFTEDVWSDLFSIYDYIALNDSERRADQIFSGLQCACSGLKELPERGYVPPELEGRVRADIREIRFKPYRIVYCVQKSRVDVLAVFDGRRDARSLIEQRTFRR